MLQQPNKIYDYHEQIGEVAKQLHIYEPQITQILQHQIELMEKQPLEKADIVNYDFKDIDRRFQQQINKKKESLWKQLDTDTLRNLELNELYEKFNNFKKDGASQAQIFELKNEIAVALQKFIK